MAQGAHPGAARVAYLGHATVLIECGAVRLLTDPLLRDRVFHLRRQVAPVAAAATQALDAVLISHLHADHLDLASLHSLGPDTRLLVPVGAGAWLRSRGFSEVSELAAGESTSVGALGVSAVEARHDGRRRPLGGPRAETIGYLVRGDSALIYFAGDTECFEGMAGLGEGLDVALLPVAGWGPTLGPGHMDALQAAQATRLLAPRIAIPIHWGTLLPLGLERRHRPRLGDPPQRFAEHAARLAPGTEVVILAPGEELRF